MGDVAASGELVDLADVRKARELIGDVVRYTPLEPCRPLSSPAGPDGVGHSTWLKCENLQRAGSFKVRGAYVRIARLSAEERARGVVAASAGNHAQGVAVAADLCRTSATVFMPVGAALPKVAATRGYGAQVRMAGETVDEALAAAAEFAEATGAVLIHPFDHPDIISGQGTVGLEILEQRPDVDTVVVGVGGGGLISGIAAAVKGLRPGVRVVGVQAAGAASMLASREAGRPVRLDRMMTVADGIAVGCPGDLTFEHVRAYVDELVTVTDEDISRAIVMLLERCKLVVEPAGAVAVAALLAHVVEPAGCSVAVLSGGNIDPMMLVSVIEHGLAAAGRYLRVTVRCPDRPGQLARMLSLIAAQGANVDDVVHARHDPRLALGEVEVELSVETRGSEQSGLVIAALRDAGYTVTLTNAYAPI